MLIVGLLLKAKLTTILDELIKFLRHATTKLFYSALILLLTDTIVLIVLVAALESLPRQGTFQKVQ